MNKKILEVNSENIVFDKLKADLFQETSFDTGSSDASRFVGIEETFGSLAGGFTNLL